MSIDYSQILTAEERAAAARKRTVPASISAVQFRVQASRAGILNEIEAIIADPATDAEVKIAWEHAREFERASPTIEALRQHASIDLTAEEVDDLFRQAADIKV